MPRIADARTATIDDLDGAKALFQDLALQTLERDITIAEFEASIAILKQECERSTGPARDAIESHVDRLSKFILANKRLFESPRKIKTPFGAFGLQTATDLLVDDEPGLLAWLSANGHTDCIESKPRINKTKVKDLLAAGLNVPGVVVRTGDTAVYTISKTWLEQEAARAKAG
jgi:hypothetical protein